MTCAYCGCRDISCSCSEYEQQLADLRAKMREWNVAASELCPGSEFVDDPKRVFKHLSERLKTNLELHAKLKEAERERDQAVNHASARLLQLETQLRIHSANTTEWKQALDQLRDERDAFAAALEDACKQMEIIAAIVPTSSSGQACALSAKRGRDVLKNSTAILAARDRRIRQETLEEAITDLQLEEELEGPIPDEMIKAVEKYGLEMSLRVSAITMKQALIKRLRRLAEEE